MKVCLGKLRCLNSVPCDHKVNEVEQLVSRENGAEAILYIIDQHSVTQLLYAIGAIQRERLMGEMGKQNNLRVSQTGLRQW